MHTLQSKALHQIFICVNKTDTLAWIWKTKWNKCKKYRDVRLYKSGVRSKDNTLMWFAFEYFSYFFYDEYIANYWMVPFKICFSLIFLPSEIKKKKTMNRLLSNKELIFRIPFCAPRFQLTSYFCRLKFMGMLVYASRKSSNFLSIL